MEIEEALAKIGGLAKKAPVYMTWKIGIANTDACGGYGWHQVVFVTLYEVDIVCQKCGYSDIHGGDDDAHPNGRHSWVTKERTIFFRNSYGKTFEKFVDEIGEFIEGYNKH